MKLTSMTDSYKNQQNHMLVLKCFEWFLAVVGRFLLRRLTLFGGFGAFWGVLVVFSDSLVFSVSIPLLFVPKDPLGADCGPKQKT